MWNTLINIAGASASILLIFSYLPQILQLHRTKQADGISLNFWYILNAALVMTTLIAFDTFLETGNIVMFVTQALNLCLGLTVMFQVIRIRSKDKKKK